MTTVKLTPGEPAARDLYWSTTQSELRSAKRRGDLMVLAGAAALLTTLAFNRDRVADLGFWLVLATLLAGLISYAAWVVARRKRDIAAARGMICSQCEYTPHDTEIEELVETRHCPRCSAEV
jgi:hypothetical protein